MAMAGFKFRLEFMISLRKRREEEAAVKLAKRLASIRELEDQINACHLKLAEMADELSQLSALGQITGPLLLMYSNYQEKIRKEIKRLLELLALSRREEAKERMLLRKAVVDRRIMEKFKENKKLTWKTDREKEEQELMEELASLSRARKKLEEPDEDPKPMAKD
ncbi:MAG: flagellar export protein FliJ [Deltaproteobacteria bacterium]|jgi:flagellar export protein FliJ|nr:flagellar export protein FliJ [Deltaproteobacteria bacterium]